MRSLVWLAAAFLGLVLVKPSFAQNLQSPAPSPPYIAAAAAGGALGALIELTIDPGAIPRPLLHNVVATGATAIGGSGESMLAASFTPVEPGETLVIATIRARWQFLTAAR